MTVASNQDAYCGIPETDLLIEAYPPRVTGGQTVGTGPNGVRVTHLPSGLIAISDAQRSQHRNRAVAFEMIIGGLTSRHFSL